MAKALVSILSSMGPSGPLGGNDSDAWRCWWLKSGARNADPDEGIVTVAGDGGGADVVKTVAAGLLLGLSGHKNGRD